MSQSEFSKSVKATVARRASYICSNPRCRTLTISLIDDETLKIVYKGRTVHICAPTHHGARYDASMTGNQRKAIDNAIFLCAKCAELISRNKGASYPAELLREWKEQHKRWVRTHLNGPEKTAPLRLVKSSSYVAATRLTSSPKHP
jgi:hypothetical protein